MTNLNLSLIGCSDMAALLGLSSYPDQNPWALWMRIVHGKTMQRESTMDIIADLGREREEATARVYARHFLGIEQPKIYKPDSRELDGWLRYSLDPLTGVEGGWTGLVRNGQPEHIMEVKERNEFAVATWGPEGTGEVDPKIYAQVQAQLACLRRDRDHWTGTSIPDLDRVHLAVALMGGKRMASWVIERNDDVGQALLEKAEQFWRDHVLTKTPPPVDDTDGASWAMHQLYPAPKGRPKPRPATPREEEIIEMYRAAKAAEDEAEAAYKEALKARKQLRNRLQFELGSDYSVETEAGSKVTSYEVRPKVSQAELVKALAKRAGITAEELKRLEDSCRTGESFRNVRVTLK